MATSRDVQEIITKLSSDKPKSRDEGIRLLNSWLEGERSIGFCKLLANNTSRIKPDEIPHAETWPFLVTLLTKCITLEISASKKRPPKLLLAKTLRTAIQCAEDAKLSGSTGHKLLLLSVVKLLFNHICDVIKDVPSFQSEYSSILRHLLLVKEYRYQMRKRVYCNLVVIYVNKAKMAISMGANIQSGSKEELFRCILTLHVLLENPPGDFPENTREDLVKGFTEIFSYIRDEGKISRKLMECINTYLIKDGPNLGYEAMKIHSSVQEFMLRCWLTTHDRGLKNSLIVYAKLQLKLSRIMPEECPLIDQLLDIVAKELDHSTIACTGAFWSDISRDDKVGCLGSTQQGLMELAAAVFYQACTIVRKMPHQEKRLKMEDAGARVKVGIMKGSYLWNGSLYFLIRNYGHRIDKSLLIEWFDGACGSLQRILNDTSTVNSYDALLWLLWALQEISSVLILPSLKGPLQCPSTTSNEVMMVRNRWHGIWTSLMHGLPIFSNATPVVDIALTLLGNMIVREQIGAIVVPEDLWDLRFFKHMPSSSALFFISSYFSSRSVQDDDLRDVLHVRKNLLRATMELVNSKEPICLTENIVMLIPAAAFSLCAGCAPLLPDSRETNIFLVANEDRTVAFSMEGGDPGLLDEVFECSVEVLSEMKIDADVEVETEQHRGIRLPRKIRQPLIHEMEEYITTFLSSRQGLEKIPLVDLVNACSLLCYWIYSSKLARLREANPLCKTRMSDYIPELMDCIVSAIEEKCREIQCRGSVDFVSIFDASGSTLSSLRRLISCPLFNPLMGTNDNEFLGISIQTVEKLLVALAKLFAMISNCSSDNYSGTDAHGSPFSSSVTCQESNPMGEQRALIVDMDLDVDDGSKDADPFAACRSNKSVTSSSPVQWKSKLVSVISEFVAVLPLRTWEILLDMMGKEIDDKVSDKILYNLCRYFPGSAGSFPSLVTSVNNMIEKSGSLKLCCVSVLSAVHALLETLLSSSFKSKLVIAKKCTAEMMSEEDLYSLGDLVNKVAETGLTDWFARIKLIECICCFVLLEPRIGQALIGGLLAMLQDVDFRVRLFLARRIGVLFRMWEGHSELFEDICSSFGVDLVRMSKEKLVKTPEVISAGATSVLAMETALITLAHLALCSEEAEVEAVFMMCVVAAKDPCQRKLVYALLDNLSKRLKYASRSTYLEELIGPILARWVACEVSLLALVEVRDLFVIMSEQKRFMESCCPWLLPLLILQEDMSNLNWVSKVACKPLSLLAKEYFVPIFAVCMAVHCSAKPGKETGGKVLRYSILRVGEISERERDDLIKKNMVSVVSFLLSLTSSSADPAMPYFSKDTILLSVQTVVDGFFEMDEHPAHVGIVDKINIFRPDRVFKFLVEMHYQVTAANLPRHKCHRLSAIEVLVNVLGHRTAVASTSNYIFNIVGQCIFDPLLQDQCCGILSTILEKFKCNPQKEAICILGEQLQFLVSKLVACCIPSDNQSARTGIPSSRVISLLHQLTMDADPSLNNYIRRLEPFPEVDCLEQIRMFHEDLCKAYSPRDHFLMFVRRSYSLPHGLLIWSLRNLHKRLLSREIIVQETNVTNKYGEGNYWNCDPEVVSAVWDLVGLCGSGGENNMGGLLADFISRVGIGDPYCVVFHLSKNSKQKNLLSASCNEVSKEASLYAETGVTKELLINLLRLLKRYLLDDSVKNVDIASQTLQGILSTERGQVALLSLDAYERSLIAVHSKGVNLQTVDKLLLDVRKDSRERFSLEDSSIWSTQGKTYEIWVCSLVHLLIGLCDDVILRLCQDIVLLKAEVADLLFPYVLVNLAGSHGDHCQLISAKVQETIFAETNDLIKSIQVLLNALNRLRSFFVAGKANTISTPVKLSKPSSSLKSRSASGKSKDHTLNVLLNISWEKVYWLTVDYLVVATAAIRCGSYFTAIMYVEHWCEEQFHALTLGCPDFFHMEQLPQHIRLLVAAVTQINEPDSIYGIIRSHKLASQLITYEHEGNWSKALEYYDLLARSPSTEEIDILSGRSSANHSVTYYGEEDKVGNWKCYKGLMRSLQKTGCTHVLDIYCQGLTSQIGQFQHDSEFTELQYEAAWRAGNWDFSLLTSEVSAAHSRQQASPFNQNLHSCLRALQEGDADEFCMKLVDSKKELVLSISDASRESTEYIYSTIIKLQILDHLGMAWDLRWKPYLLQNQKTNLMLDKDFPEPVIPTKFQLESLNADWSFILRQAQLHLNLLEPFISFRRVMLQILDCKECITEHLLKSASTLRKGSRFSLATAALHELKLLCCQTERQEISHTYFLTRLEEAKILRAQGQHEMAISLAKYILLNFQMGEETSNVYRLVGKWLAETRSSNSRTILEQYLKHSVELIELSKSKDKASISRQCQTFFHLAHYTDGLFKSYEERLASNEWQAAMQLRRHKTKELDALIKRLKSSTKGEKTDYSVKIQELQKQLTMDREEAEKLQDDRDSFLSLALEGYQRCLVIGGKYDLRVVFRLVSLWFSLYSRNSVVKAMHSTVKEVQSYKFVPLVYQIASRLGSSKDGQGSISFQLALVSLVKKMAIDHPYHTMFQLLALANGNRIKDKQRSRNSFVVDMDKKLAAENLLNELSLRHGAIIQQMKQMVEIYIKLAELETKREETNRKILLPREIRSVRQLELVPVVTANIPVDPSCQYKGESFPHFKGLADSIMVMNGINAPKVVECFGSDGHKYRQLAKSGNDDLRQDAVMEQFFDLVNTFLQSQRDTWKRRLRIRTYKVVPFTPSAGVLEWVDRTIPLGEYLIGSTRNGGAHGRYGIGDWSFLQCREHMANEKDKRKAFLRVCEKFRPVMHHFFLEKFLQPADWFESRLSYTRSVAASSMVGYIVGLGDRHSMNILIDQATAEVVHIDLGVAFEQGLMLKTPERVPFRLTRDIVDGMGVTGVEGVFRRCCEETLSVMRTNKEALLTIIEVFIHDPLYKWALSPLKALQRQKETDDDTDSSLESSQDEYEGNKDAARATLRVKQKLDGYEEGEMRSVQGQVQQLIQDAIDTDRLCQMFPGWGAWL